MKPSAQVEGKSSTTQPGVTRQQLRCRQLICHIFVLTLASEGSLAATGHENSGERGFDAPLPPRTGVGRWDRSRFAIIAPASERPLLLNLVQREDN